MTQSFQVSLRAGEKIYINGAVLRVDRKVTIELLNDVSFLLENHVLQPEDATTPLRQLYFVVQTILMEPDDRAAKVELFQEFHSAICSAFESQEVLDELAGIAACVEGGRHFEALRAIRRLFEAERKILDTVNFDLAKLNYAQRRDKNGSYAA